MRCVGSEGNQNEKGDRRIRRGGLCGQKNDDGFEKIETSRNWCAATVK
jgi:hypothetical protein